MAGWWRHVLLSRIHQRPLPCDFIILFKFLSCPEATFFSEGNVWLSLVVTVAQKMRFSRGSGAANVPLSLEAIRCWYYFALEPILGLHSLFWNFQVMHEVGTSLLPFAVPMLLLHKNSVLNFINFQHSHQTFSASWDSILAAAPEGRKEMHRLVKRVEGVKEDELKNRKHFRHLKRLSGCHGRQTSNWHKNCCAKGLLQ